MRLSAQNLKELREQGLSAKLSAPKPSKYPSESVEQQALVRWWNSCCRAKWNLPPFALMAFPLQGYRTPRNGARMKREGVRKGTLDMLLFAPRRGKSCLWIENKTPVGKLTDEQQLMRDFLLHNNAMVVTCRSAEDGILAIEYYLL